MLRTNNTTLLIQSLSICLGYTALFFVILTSVGGYIGTDIYYHVQHAAHIASEGFSALTANIWLPQHFFTLHPVNPYLLYHLLLASIFMIAGTANTTLVVMLLSSGIAASFFTVLYSILRSYHVSYASIWTLFTFLGSTSFIYRLLLIRPFTVGIIFCMLGTWLLIRKQYLWVGILSTIYILTYNLAVFLILPAVVIMFVQGYVEKSWSLKPIIAVLGGITLGLIIHPQTLSYILLIKAHLFDIFVLQLQGVPLSVGGEIVPHVTRTFFALHSIPLLLYIGAAIILLAKIYTPPEHLKVPIFSFAILSLCWFPITIGVHRGLEYWYPMTVLTIILVYSGHAQHILPSILTKTMRYVLPLVTLIITSGIYLLFFVSVREEAIASATTVSALTPFISTIEATSETIWYPTWYLFPKLYYSLSSPVGHTFIAGFDPVFTYLYNTDVYYTWYLLSTKGKACFSQTDCPEALMPSDIISTMFDAELIISPKTEQTAIFRKAIHLDPKVKNIQETDMYALYQIVY